MSDQLRNASMWSAPVDVAGWWKLVVAGPVIIIAVIISASLGVDAWIVGFAAVIFAVLLCALGLVLGFVQLMARRSATART